MADTCDAYNASATTRPFPEHLGVEGSPGRGEVEAAPSCHVTSTGPKCYFQGG